MSAFAHSRDYQAVAWESTKRTLCRKDLVELFFNPLLGPVPRDGELLHDEPLGGVEHSALPEGQRLRVLQPVEIAIDLGDLEERAGLDLLHEATIATVPRLLVDVDFLLAEDVHDLLDLRLRGHLAEPHVRRLVRGHQDAHVAAHDAEEIKRAQSAANLLGLDANDFGDPLGRIDDFVSDLEL